MPFKKTKTRSFAQILILLSLSALYNPASADPAAPWRAQEALGLPHWLHLSGSHRTRYETLDGQFRAGRDGDDQMIALRTIVLTELRFAPVNIGVEVIDSRAMLDDRGSPLNTTMVNPAEILQAYLSVDTGRLPGAGGTSSLKLGRMTLDVGSRRLVARSLFRNTINTFTGAEWRWRGAGGDALQVFYTLPVNRKPNTANALGNNAIEFDEEDTEVQFWGVHYTFAQLPGGHQGDIYLLGLDERDAGRRQSANRELYIPGLRLFRPQATASIDYLFETAFQLGESRASTSATDVRDLDHFAHFQHVELGYTFSGGWKPRLNVEFDHASGDDNPNDGDNNRFDTLFGARRFEFGPTGIYGAFARSNLLSPGLRLNVKPARAVSVMLAYRGFWLASDTDAWTTAGVRDSSGSSGSFIGQQIEGRLRIDVLPDNYLFEAGVAALFDGEFIRRAPNSPRQGDSVYAYTQVGLTF